MKNATPEIKQITISQALPIRYKVMWPDKPMSYVELSNDEKGNHFGLFVNGEITSIISLFISDNEAQFRKFATLIEFQGFGYGTILLKEIIALIKKEGVKKLWCNARVEKSKFYEKFDLNSTTKKFKKGGIEYINMEREFLN